MWVASVDFQKAFDSIQHDAIWEISQESLCQWAKHLSFGKDVCWPTRHRLDGRGEQWIRDLSWKKPRDPSSSFLPDSVLKDIGFWNEKGLGIKLGRRENRLHIQPEICWRRAYRGELFETAQKGWWLTSESAQKRKSLTFTKTKRKFSPLRTQTSWKKSRLTGYKPKYFFLKEKSNIWDRWSHSWIIVPDKMVTQHDFFFRIDYVQLHYMTWRFDNYHFSLHDIVGSFEGDGSKWRRKREEKERATETDTETHKTTRQRYRHWLFCLCLSVFCLGPCLRFICWCVVVTFCSNVS